MPKYEFKDLYVPSFGTSGSATKSEPTPPMPFLTIDFTEIKQTYLRAEFVFTDGGGDSEAPDRDFDWIEIKRPPEPPSDPTPAPNAAPIDGQTDLLGSTRLDTEDSSALILDDVFLF